MSHETPREEWCLAGKHRKTTGYPHPCYECVKEAASQQTDEIVEIRRFLVEKCSMKDAGTTLDMVKSMAYAAIRNAKAIAALTSPQGER